MRAVFPLFLLALTGCLDSLFESLPPAPFFPTSASFAITSTSYRLDTVQVGTIVLFAADSGRLTGTWDLGWAPSVDSTLFPGLISGTGVLTGSVRGSEASITLFGADTLRRMTIFAYADTIGWGGSWNYQTESARRRGGRVTARLLP